MFRARPRTPPGLSVVIPLYNHAAYVGQAIESVLAQAPAAAEIIVVDDGSDDGSAGIVRERFGGRPEIVLWSQPNQGAHHALNAGIHRATGEVIAILNSDDAFVPGRFEACLSVLRRNPGITAVTTALGFMDERGAECANPWYEDSRRECAAIGDPALALIHRNYFMTTSNLVIRRDAFREVGFFRGLRYAHDLEFFLRLLRAGRRIEFLDRPLLRYRLHAGNTIREDAQKVRVEWAAVAAYHLYCLGRAGRAPAGSPEQAAAWHGIVARNNLSVLAAHLLLYYQTLPAERVEPDAFLADDAFGRFIHELAR
jgi:glycosyltransferase involved in cell wall biosynthesis